MTKPVGYMVVSYDESGAPWLDAGWGALYSSPADAEAERESLAADEPESRHVVCSVTPVEADGD